MSDSDDTELQAVKFDNIKAMYRERYKDMDLGILVRLFAQSYGTKEAADARAAEAQAEFDVLRLELIPAAMEAKGIENQYVTGIGRVGLTGDMYVRPLDKNAFHNWLREENLDDLISEAVNPSTLKAFTKKRIKAGKPIPDGLLKVTPFTRASITKA